jgi:Cof subfamily protein (haloacid dehalogenase superfamily)
MAVRALFFDIDGTVLNSKGVMSDSVYHALLRCQADGLLIGMVTARSGRIVFRDYEVPGDSRVLLERGVYYSGGTVFDRLQAFYQHTPIPGDTVAELVATIGQYDDGLQIALQHDDLYHAFKQGVPDEELALWGFRREEILDFAVASGRATTKMMVFSGTTWRGTKEDVSELYGALDEHFGEAVNLILADSRRCIYVLSRHATKGRAIQTLISLYDISPEEVAVFGDDTPDIGMFSLFGHSIAMGNAHASLKKAASYVTLSNDEDGVVHALRNHLKIL